MDAAIQYILYFAVLVVLAVPLGRFMAHIMDGEHTFLSPVIAPVERGVYRLLRIDAEEQMGCRRYLASVLVFSGIGLVALAALQALQSFLPGNPQHLPGVSWDLSFNTAASFITNTNWQSYSGETTLSYFVQFMGLTVQNFLSAGTGIAVMFALIRGFRQVKEQGLGSFWVDLTRTVLYVLIPLNLVFGICLAAGGVISNFQPAQKAELVEPVAVQPNADGGWSVIDGAQIEGDTVKVDGKVVGSELIGQNFEDEGHMWGRIQNVSIVEGDDGEPMAYGAPSNLSPASEEYRQLVDARVEKIRAANPDADMDAVPVDLVTCSGSGLDPEISPDAAEYQVPRLAKATGKSEGEVREIIAQCTKGRFLGVFGEPTVNVLKVNLMLDGAL